METFQQEDQFIRVREASAVFSDTFSTGQASGRVRQTERGQEHLQHALVSTYFDHFVKKWNAEQCQLFYLETPKDLFYALSLSLSCSLWDFVGFDPSGSFSSGKREANMLARYTTGPSSFYCTIRNYCLNTNVYSKAITIKRRKTNDVKPVQKVKHRWRKQLKENKTEHFPIVDRATNQLGVPSLTWLECSAVSVSTFCCPSFCWSLSFVHLSFRCGWMQ